MIGAGVVAVFALAATVAAKKGWIKCYWLAGTSKAGDEAKADEATPAPAAVRK
jgi:hypothetical protein